MRTNHTHPISVALGLALTLSISILLVRTTRAQKTTPRVDAADTEEEIPFHFNGVTWRDKREYLERARCSTHVPTLDEQDDIERRAEQLPASRAQVSPMIESQPVVINVHFHVIRSIGAVEGNVTLQTIKSQIDILNAAYNGSGFQFQLASIERRNNDNWFNSSPGTQAEARMKRTLRQGTAEDLNIYTLNAAGGLTGWSTFPWEYADHPKLDGVVLLYSALPGGTAAPYNEGDVAVHEIGHWLGLYHTFQGGCHNPGDSVSDTPSERVPNFDCPLGRDTCPTSVGLDPVTNYMDDTDDACMFEFTPGQIARIGNQWLTFRAGF